MILLPWPPTVNKYWRHAGAKVLLSEQGRAYKKVVRLRVLAAGVRPIREGAVSLRVRFYPKDNRRRDLDNLLKALLDALSPGVYTDDAQVKEIHAVMMKPRKDLKRPVCAVEVASYQQLEGDIVDNV